MVRFLSTITFLILIIQLDAQRRYTIHGTITDAGSSEQLISAVIFETKSLQGTNSNNFGFYSLSLIEGEVSIQYQYVGYEPVKLQFNLHSDTLINIGLRSGLQLEQVVITSNKEEKIDRSTRMSTIDVPIAQIKKVPALFGEVDVLKVLQLLPGVSGGTEGTSGLYVRGGSPDQNLILLDGVPVYNVSHVGGIFSTFNSDALKNVTLTKGGFPARYGGRLSSVLEINMKEGNMNEFHGEGGIGAISSRLTLEGPIVKDKASFMISGRRTYLDVLANLIIQSDPETRDEIGYLALFFHDLNAKVNWKVNPKHRLYLSCYNGKDKFGLSYKDEFGSSSTETNGNINWGNITTALRWNYAIRPNLFANTTLTYSRYQFNLLNKYTSKIGSTTESFGAKYYSGINDLAGRIDFDYTPIPKHAIKFGIHSIRHQYNPGALAVKFESKENNQPIGSQLDTLLGNASTYSNESSIYFEDDIRFGSLGINAGLHASNFNVKTKNYFSLQPRFSARYLLANDYTIKASFATMAQYINLLTNEGIGLPTDLWVPSTRNIRPQQSWQIATGIVKVFQEEYETSIECFYKKMNDVISYKEGANFFGIGSNWEEKITQGKGEVYGSEFFVQKKKGKLNGWVGYTLSWNNRTFAELNGGKTYRFKFDRRHDIEIVGNYQLTKRWSISGSWQYATGNSVTLPVIKYRSPSRYALGEFYGSTEVNIYGSKNAYSMPSYHRLDLSFEWRKKKKRFESAWNIGIYNAYNHANPFFITTDIEKDNSSPTGFKSVFKQISLLPFLPNASYLFKF